MNAAAGGLRMRSLWLKGFLNSADRDTLLEIAKEHLQAIVLAECRKPPTRKSAVSPSGIW